MSFNIIKREAGKLINSQNVLDLFSSPKKTGNSKWLFLTPYDYDSVMGAGMLIQAAITDNVKIRVVIATDGAQGYANEIDKNEITEIRRKETILSYFSLGIKDIECLNFPDSNLHYFVGRTEANNEEDYCVINGYGGLQNVLTYHIRNFQPDLIFVGSRNEFQSEYRIIFQETLFSIFNASRKIWPELGTPLEYNPGLIEFPVFRNFSKDPNIRLQGDEIMKSKKLEAIRYFVSQKQIEPLVELIKNYPPDEYFYEANCNLYNSESYRSLFE